MDQIRTGSGGRPYGRSEGPCRVDGLPLIDVVGIVEERAVGSAATPVGADAATQRARAADGVLAGRGVEAELDLGEVAVARHDLPLIEEAGREEQAAVVTGGARGRGEVVGEAIARACDTRVRGELGPRPPAPGDDVDD